MRIRKQAAKLLGWASGSSFPASSSLQLSPFDHYGWPPEPPCVQSAESYSGELQCRLNLSPWDAFESSQCADSQDAMLDFVNEDPMSAFENSSEAKENEKEKTEEEEEEEEHDNKVQRRNRGEKETEASDSIAVINCKKTDGKGWHCKRPAQSPHSLCTYHLTQLRSYRARFEDHVSGDHRKKTSSAVDCGGRASSYYYYSILGPWWGKRRGSLNGSSDSNEDCGGKSADNEAHVVDGDNGEEEAEEEEEEEEEEEDEEEDGDSHSDVIYKKKKKRVIKRRGRKPVKARSLKSLL